MPIYASQWCDSVRALPWKFISSPDDGINLGGRFAHSTPVKIDRGDVCQVGRLSTGFISAPSENSRTTCFIKTGAEAIRNMGRQAQQKIAGRGRHMA